MGLCFSNRIKAYTPSNTGLVGDLSLSVCLPISQLAAIDFAWSRTLLSMDAWALLFIVSHKFPQVLSIEDVV